VEITVTNPGLAAATGGLAGGSQPVPVCIRSACRSSVQVSSKERCRFRRLRKMGKPVAANKFVLKHHQVEVDYTLGATPGIPVLIYRDGPSTTKSFTASEITTDQTGLGTLVSVALVTSIDTGGERFGFFLPQLDVPRGESEEFRTVGVYERFSGPDSIPHRDPSWRCIELDGTAQTVIVEL
jgi:hypothetical protein